MFYFNPNIKKICRLDGDPKYFEILITGETRVDEAVKIINKIQQKFDVNFKTAETIVNDQIPVTFMWQTEDEFSFEFGLGVLMKCQEIEEILYSLGWTVNNQENMADAFVLFMNN